VVAMTKLNNMNAELLEFVVTASSNVANKIIRDIDIPRSAIIGGVIRDGEGCIALGDFKIESNDRVVVCCLPQAISKVEKLFA
jgi:trk system potassium uptake protein TrkA